MTTFSVTVRGQEPYSPPTLRDGSLVEIEDMCRDGLSVAMSQYANSPRWRAWVCALLKQGQKVETDIIAFRTLTSIEDSEGAQLDKLGEILGEERESRSDPDYRRGLRTRVLVNRSSGRAEEMIEIARLWQGVGDDVSVGYMELYPAHMTIIPRPVASDPVRLFRRLVQAKAGGVSLTLRARPATRTFKFSRTTSPEPGDGFGHTTPGAAGAVLAYVVG